MLGIHLHLRFVDTVPLSLTIPQHNCHARVLHGALYSGHLRGVPGHGVPYVVNIVLDTRKGRLHPNHPTLTVSMRVRMVALHN